MQSDTTEKAIINQNTVECNMYSLHKIIKFKFKRIMPNYVAYQMYAYMSSQINLIKMQPTLEYRPATGHIHFDNRIMI